MKLQEELISRLAGAERVAVLTGAGVSAESGIPTFREAQTGMWAKFRAEDLATPRAFIKNPQLVWEWYEWRRKLVSGAEPNPAHRALAAMEEMFPEFHLITQNVDGLHQRAGSREVIELHGNITRTKCFEEGVVVPEWPETDEIPPKCPRCGGWLRPDVVWFEEPLPEQALEIATSAARNCQVFLSIGTSTVVYPAAGLPFEALRCGATVVEINPSQTSFTDKADFVLAGAAGTMVPLLLEALEAARKG